MDPQPAAPGAARPDWGASEQRWRELNAELDAAEAALSSLQPTEGSLITPEIVERLEAAKRRRYHVQFEMLDFLDTLDASRLS